MTDKIDKIRQAQEALGRELVARTSFEKEAVWLPSLAVNHWNAGQMVIDGKTFTDCVIEGPAVMAVMEGVTFEGCSMGVFTDVRTLLYSPLGAKMAGVVGMANCKFVRCSFAQVGFTGSPELLAEFQADIRPLSETKGAGPAA